MNAQAPALADTQIRSFISTFDSISLSKGRAELADAASDPQHDLVHLHHRLRTHLSNCGVPSSTSNASARACRIVECHQVHQTTPHAPAELWNAIKYIKRLRTRLPNCGVPSSTKTASARACRIAGYIIASARACRIVECRQVHQLPPDALAELRSTVHESPPHAPAELRGD